MTDGRQVPDLDPAIRRARPAEASELSALALRSKAYWGYDAERVSAWAADLRYEGKDVHVVDADGLVAAYATLVLEGEKAELDELWVEPAWIGKGVGARLFQFVSNRAAALGAKRLEWEADPHAVGFYERMGGSYVRDGEPGEWGRILPVMAIDL